MEKLSDIINQIHELYDEQDITEENELTIHNNDEEYNEYIRLLRLKNDNPSEFYKQVFGFSKTTSKKSKRKSGKKRT